MRSGKMPSALRVHLPLKKSKAAVFKMKSTFLFEAEIADLTVDGKIFVGHNGNFEVVAVDADYALSGVYTHAV